jgi:hypothetical protein
MMNPRPTRVKWLVSCWLVTLLCYKLFVCVLVCLRTKGDEMTGGWRKLHNGELHNLYSSPDIINMITSRRMRWARHVARIWEKRNIHRILVGKPEGTTPLGRPRRRWVKDIKMDLRWNGVVWIGFIWLRIGINGALLWTR